MRIPAWLLGCIAIAGGIVIGMWVASAQGIHLSARAPLAPYKELPELPVASSAKPAARIGRVVEMTPYSYLPEAIDVHPGEAIEFRNAGTAKQWPVSDHALLDAGGVVEPGRSWYAVPTVPGTYTVHDEVYPSVKATVFVR